MTRKLSMALLIVQAVLLALPLTVALLFASGLLVVVALETGLRQWRDFEALPLLVFDLMAVVAVAAEWRMLIMAWRRGALGLRQLRPIWWYLAAMGTIPLALGLVAALVPGFYDDGPALFILGAPFALILGHLWAEARFREAEERQAA